LLWGRRSKCIRIESISWWRYSKRWRWSKVIGWLTKALLRRRTN
jgi:hypothetical protein